MDRNRPGNGQTDQGVPAYAGMDLAIDLGTIDLSRVPRLRGDGPVLRSSMSCWSLCSPPTRGWTVLDPQRVQTRMCSPPTRGWTDPGGIGADAETVFPAYAGWTVLWECIIIHPAVFPAYAGMDRNG